MDLIRSDIFQELVVKNLIFQDKRIRKLGLATIFLGAAGWMMARQYDREISQLKAEIEELKHVTKG